MQRSAEIPKFNAKIITKKKLKSTIVRHRISHSKRRIQVLIEQENARKRGKERLEANNLKKLRFQKKNEREIYLQTHGDSSMLLSLKLDYSCVMISEKNDENRTYKYTSDGSERNRSEKIGELSSKENNK